MGNIGVVHGAPSGAVLGPGGQAGKQRGRVTIRNGLLVAGAMVLAGCNVIPVKDLVSVGGSVELTQVGSSSSAPSGAQSSPQSGGEMRGDPRKGPAAPDPRLVELHRSLDYTCCTEGRKRGSDYYKKAGLETIGVFKYGNPDPEWLPGWSYQASTEDLMDAVVQAAVNRTWLKKCHADWAEYRAGIKKIEDTHRPRLAEIRKRSNYYERSAGLVNLMVTLLGDVDREKLELRKMHPTARVGLGYEIVAALFETHREMKRGFRMRSYLNQAWSQIELYGKHGRPWSSDEAFERDAFCMSAQRLGTHKTPELPSLGPWDPKAYAMIRWPFTEAREDEIETKLAEAGKATAAALTAPAEFGITGLDMGFREEEERTPGVLFYAEQFVVEKVEAAGDKTKIVARRHEAKPLEYDCRRTNRIDSVDPNGYVRYAVDCKLGTKERDVVVSLSFGDLPASVTPQKGDEIVFYATIVDRKDKTLKNLPNHLHHLREYTLDGQHLAQVKRDDKVVIAY